MSRHISAHMRTPDLPCFGKVLVASVGESCGSQEHHLLVSRPNLLVNRPLHIEPQAARPRAGDTNMLRTCCSRVLCQVSGGPHASRMDHFGHRRPSLSAPLSPRLRLGGAARGVLSVGGRLRGCAWPARSQERGSLGIRAGKRALAAPILTRPGVADAAFHSEADFREPEQVL